MDFSELSNLRDFGVIFDEKKKRAELELEDNGGKIIAYFPSDSIQVFIYDIHTEQAPDFGMDYSGFGRYLRVNICKSGRCEFITKSGDSLYLSEGEFAMDYGTANDGSFRFDTRDYTGVEIIMQIDSVINELPILAMLKKAIKEMNLPEKDIKTSSVYFADTSANTARTLNELMDYGKDGADSSLIVIKVSEIGHNLGTDLFNSKSKLRTFATNSQTQIAQDVHKTLTEHYGDKNPASLFAERYGMSETAIKNYFKNAYGYGYKEYQMKVRMEKSAELLRDTNTRVSEISKKAGYLTASKFCAAFKRFYGVTPMEYRRTERIKKVNK
ncbi:AraC family transcriptional regulator [uncultured Ruminococcus sp.]|uniref:helix-turn-helix domain-containing protein n=1 Tax=uncultured Ruminococcus sp. TaxID=165186 RepID=UPI00292F6293|nr:AraC family transcriptional regulator [uncultured Ruminococcus sp.]